MNSSNPHTSVLLEEVLEHFQSLPLKVFLDGTLGAGGHAAAILEAHPEIELFIGLDQDPLARKIAGDRLASFGSKVKIIASNFQNMGSVLKSLGVEAVDGMLFDLGVSSMQLDLAERGFSFSKEGPLDMRMDPSQPISAYEVVNHYGQRELENILKAGEVKKWRLAAMKIVSARARSPLTTTRELARVLEGIGNTRDGKIHEATLVFQAIRIEVNQELLVLENMLKEAPNFLRAGGRMGVISFHSLEDRCVKETFREMASDKVEGSCFRGAFLPKVPTVEIVTKKPVVPLEKEIKMNPRARSAKLRFIQKSE